MQSFSMEWGGLPSSGTNSSASLNAHRANTQHRKSRITVNRTGLVLVSLIITVPGAFLAVLMVMNFLQRAGDLSGMLLVLSGLTLLVSALVALAPMGILVFIPKSKTADEEEGSEEERTASEGLSTIVEQAEDLAAEEFEPESDDMATEVPEAQNQSDEDFFMEEDEDIESGDDDSERR